MKVNSKKFLSLERETSTRDVVACTARFSLGRKRWTMFDLEIVKPRFFVARAQSQNQFFHLERCPIRWLFKASRNARSVLIKYKLWMKFNIYVFICFPILCFFPFACQIVKTILLSFLFLLNHGLYIWSEKILEGYVYDS